MQSLAANQTYRCPICKKPVSIDMKECCSRPLEWGNMVYKFVIPGRLPNLNDYTTACNTRKFYAGAKMKREVQEKILWCLSKFRMMQFERVRLLFHWFEKDTRRDMDNVAFAKKFILDALQEKGILANDGWKQIAGFEDKFSVDAKEPRVEVYIQVLVESEKSLF